MGQKSSSPRKAVSLEMALAYHLLYEIVATIINNPGTGLDRTNDLKEALKQFGNAVYPAPKERKERRRRK